MRLRLRRTRRRSLGVASARHDLLEISKLWIELSDLTEQYEAIVGREEGDSQPLKREVRADRDQV